MKTRARSDKDKEIRRSKLLEAARKLFSERGYQSASVGEITKEAEVSTGTFYLYFKSKPEIFRTLNIEGITVLEKMIAESMASREMTAEDRLKAIAGAYLSFFRDHRDYYDIISIRGLGQDEFIADSTLLEALQNRVRDLMSFLESIIEEGIEKNEFNSVDPPRTAQMLWGLMDGILLLEQRSVSEITGLTPDDIVEKGLLVLFEGLLKN